MADGGRDYEHLAGMDAMLWSVEADPVLRNTIAVVALLDRMPDFARVAERFDRLSRLAPNFRHRLVSPPLRLDTPAWVVDQDFDLHYHVRRAGVPTPGTLDAALEYAQTSVMAGLDKDRPMWEATFLDGLNDPGGSTAIMFLKVHHVLTDGVGGLALMAHLLDNDPEGDPLGPMPPEPEAGQRGAMAMLSESLRRRQRRNVELTRRAMAGAWRAVPAMLRNPRRAVDEVIGNVRAFGKMLMPPGATESTVITGRRGWNRFGVVETTTAALVDAAKALGATVNDVYTAGVVGGVSDYHEALGAPVANLKVCIPVSVRKRGDRGGGNKVTIVRAEIPAHRASLEDRIASIHESVKTAREDLKYPLTAALGPVLNAFGPMLVPFIGAMSKGFDLVVSNVPGGNDQAYVGGARLDKLFAFGPPSGTAINVTMHTYRGAAFLGVNADAAAVSDVDLLVRSLATSFAEVERLASKAGRGRRAPRTR